MTAANALRKYEQDYQYDSVGNIKKMHHSAGLGTWTRTYQYALDSNRLTGTDTDNPLMAIAYGYDTHGNMLNLANVSPSQHLQWDHRDMIRSINLGGGGTAYYQYDDSKQRTRKRIVNRNDTGYWERIYLGGYELYRRYNVANLATPVEEIESLHLLEGEQRVLLVDDVITTDRTHANGTPFRTGPISRYQYSNQLGSACLELDHQSGVISYEEYHPYGTSAYRAMKSGTEAPPKRYRYTGIERDEESGLGYHTASYYAPWLGRWVSGDPIGVEGGLDLYVYAKNAPIVYVDPSGAAVPFIVLFLLIAFNFRHDEPGGSEIRPFIALTPAAPLVALSYAAEFDSSGRQYGTATDKLEKVAGQGNTGPQSEGALKEAEHEQQSLKDSMVASAAGVLTTLAVSPSRSSRPAVASTAPKLTATKPGAAGSSTATWSGASGTSTVTRPLVSGTATSTAPPISGQSTAPNARQPSSPPTKKIGSDTIPPASFNAHGVGGMNSVRPDAQSWTREGPQLNQMLTGREPGFRVESIVVQVNGKPYTLYRQVNLSGEPLSFWQTSPHPRLKIQMEDGTSAPQRPRSSDIPGFKEPGGVEVLSDYINEGLSGTPAPRPSHSALTGSYKR